jgi:hypothetical protein
LQAGPSKIADYDLSRFMSRGDEGALAAILIKLRA